MGDDYALWRDPFTWEPLQKPEWTEWDYLLIKAFQLIEDFTMPSGLLAWENESELVDVFAVQKVDKFEAAKEAYTKKNKERPGGYFVPYVKLKPYAKDYPTFRDWVKAENKS